MKRSGREPNRSDPDPPAGGEGETYWRVPAAERILFVQAGAPAARQKDFIPACIAIARLHRYTKHCGQAKHCGQVVILIFPPDGYREDPAYGGDDF